MKARIKGTKQAELLDCHCEIPALPEKERQAYSINHAYSRISQFLEPHRRSHSGNVFEKVWYEADGIVKPLDGLRQEAEQRHQGELVALLAMVK